MRKIVWCVGEPAVGKTTVIRELLGRDAKVAHSKAKWTLDFKRGIAAAGHYLGEPFDGADTIPYNGAMDALEFWLDNYAGYDLTILDGDRFSNGPSVVFFQQHAPEHQLVCVHFFSGDTLARREARNKVVGKAQNPTWLKGRATKALNFSAKFPGEQYQLNNVGEPAEVAKLLLKTLQEDL